MVQSKRMYDLIVYGASGFTGRHVVHHISKDLAKNGASKDGFKWALAGRSEGKLKAIFAELRNTNLPVPDGIVLANKDDQDSLNTMCSSTNLLMNCTGPYRFLGEPVVLGAIRGRCDYIDLCGEPEFMERMFSKYHDEAKEAGIVICSACAFDSIPSDLGYFFALENFNRSNTTGQTQTTNICTSVESFVSLDTDDGRFPKVHFTTYEAAVHGFGSIKNLLDARKKVKNQYGTRAKIQRSPSPNDRTLAKKCMVKGTAMATYNKTYNCYAFKNPLADAAVVFASQRMRTIYDNEKEEVFPTYSAYISLPSLFAAFIVAIMGLIFQTLAGYSFGRKILLKYPNIFTGGLFTHEGPSDDDLKHTSFEMKFISKGYVSDPISGKATYKEILTSVKGPEPGYVATPIMFHEFGKCLVEERQNIPILKKCSGGVFTPGALFGYPESTLIERLRKVGVQFEVVKTSN